MQPARVGCATSERFHWRCWHFCSCSSHKTIPSLQFPVTRLLILVSTVTAFSLKITQVFVFIARIDCKVKWHVFSLKKSINMVNYILLTMDSSIGICVSSFFNSALKNSFRQQGTKSHVSAFLKCDGNIEASCFRYIYVFRKRVISSLGDSIKFPSCFRHIKSGINSAPYRQHTAFRVSDIFHFLLLFC